jgi:predicted RNA-binding Zn-ribbon protein involved in translation (DUF1610 family)
MSRSQARHFGMAIRPVCTTCGWPMNVTRRSPHPLHGIAYEIQTFECGTCGREMTRSSDRIGLPHPSEATSNISVG